MTIKVTLSIFGLGYVGSVCSACFAARGHNVIGIDTNKVKVQNIKDGISPIIEDSLGDIIQKEVSTGRLRAISEVQQAVKQSDVSLISVLKFLLRDKAKLQLMPPQRVQSVRLHANGR